MENTYTIAKKVHMLPRLPFEGSIDLTFRCNNHCLHCWLRIPPGSPQKIDELSFQEIKGIVDQARNMGCRSWSISGGEPMLRPDFVQIFDYITANSISYSVNTNGTLITPRIAKLFKRKGSKMVALYGATADVHDHITRNPGSFGATMAGFAYLKEAGAGFKVQLIPMRDNYHQFSDMVRLARSLSRHWRVGAPWLYLSACGSHERNEEIRAQRLSPGEFVVVSRSDFSYTEHTDEELKCRGLGISQGYLLEACINAKRDFHIDPYGMMSFCCFIKDPAFRYDLRSGSFKDCWESFIPSLVNKLEMDKEYRDHCGSCELRSACQWCPAFSYLEHRRYTAKLDYLCALAPETRVFRETWKKLHRRYYRIADITVQVESDLPITDSTFHQKFTKFQVDKPGGDTVSIRHRFSLPDVQEENLGTQVYRKPPWKIYKKNDSWIYVNLASSEEGCKSFNGIAVFNHNHTRANIFVKNDEGFCRGNLTSLTLFPSDEILFARILADRNGFYLHSCGVNFDDKGMLFVGRSEAGKSTVASLLKSKAELLCDERMIIRRNQGEFRIYGTWNHSDVSEVSPSSTPLKAILFITKSRSNFLKPVGNKKETIRGLLSCLIIPFVSFDWWNKTLFLLDKMYEEIPCYELQFRKNSDVADLLRKIQ